MEDEFEFEERMAKRAMLVEKAIRYTIGLAVLAAVVAFFCRIAANKADSSASDQWMQAIENVRREAAKKEAR